MNDLPDPLEAELMSLRPHEPSPGLRRGVAVRLTDAPPARLRRLWWLAVSGGLAAACLAVVLSWWWGGPRVDPRGQGPPIIPPVAKRPYLEVENSAPTLLAYQRALARSPEELDALLDNDFTVVPEPTPEPEPIHVFTRSAETLRALLGDN